MNVEETAKAEGVKTRGREAKGGRGSLPRAGGAEGRRGGGGERRRRMSERIASCGNLCDSTNLLLQYCNNGEMATRLSAVVRK